MLERFAAAPAQDHLALVRKLQQAYAEGGLAQPLMPQASRENGLRVEHVMRSLREIASRAGSTHLPINPAAEVIDARLQDLRRALEDIDSELELTRTRAADTDLQIRSRGHTIPQLNGGDQTRLSPRKGETI